MSFLQLYIRWIFFPLRAVALGLEADDILSVDAVIDEIKTRKMGGGPGTGTMIREEVERDELGIKV